MTAQERLAKKKALLDHLKAEVAAKKELAAINAELARVVEEKRSLLSPKFLEARKNAGEKLRKNKSVTL